MTDQTYFVNGRRFHAAFSWEKPDPRRDLDDLEMPGRPEDVKADRDRPGSGYTPATCMARENFADDYEGNVDLFCSVLAAMFPHDHYVLKFTSLNEGWVYPDDLDITFENFDWDQYRQSERDVLTPQLEAWGFRNIRWGAGETDSFGPLSRTCSMTDQDGSVLRFCYG